MFDPLRRLPFPRARKAFAVAIALAGVAFALRPALPRADAAPRGLTIPRGATPAATRIDPALYARLAAADAGLRWTAQDRARDPRIQKLPRAASVAIRFDRSPSPARLAELTRAGVSFTRQSPAASGAWLARVDEHGARALEAAEDVVRVSATELLHAPHPDETTALVEARVVAAQTALRAADGAAIDGKGTIIGDIDSSVFVFHPAFFRPDGGLHAFVDVDANGVLTPGVDGIDLDGDGTIAKNEVLQRLAQNIYDERGVTTTLKAFDPARDYLFLDTNGNGKRDYGAPFTEATPAYGEPLFVADDANRDGSVAVSEKLARLGSSKIRAVRDGADYHRGSKTAPLIEYVVDVDTNEGYVRTRHGTMTSGVLVGGTESFAVHGVATGADLMVALGQDLPADIQWLLDQGANVLLTEVAPYVGVTIDGSSETEALIDAASAKGVLTVSPVGNLGMSGKHRSLTLSTGENTVLVDATDSRFDGARYVGFSVHHVGAARSIGVRVKPPGGVFTTLDPNGPITSLGGSARAELVSRVTPRGTSERHVTIVSSATSKLPQGLWEIGLDLDAGAPLDVEAYVGDELNPWSRGATFPTSNDERTICHPATSDTTIKVGAYHFYARDGLPTSALYPRASRGPLLRGGAGVDLIAPTESMTTSPLLPAGPNALGRFGGTSGAGPHVAGAIALLRQAQPDASAAALKARLFESARTDAIVQTAGKTVAGSGRLDVLGALRLREPTGAPPSLSLSVEADGTGAATIVPAVEPEGVTDLRARWDLDYDGVADTGWEPLGRRPLAGLPEGQRSVRVEILDREGHLAAATTIATVGPPLPPAAPAPEEPAAASCTCSEAGDRRGSAPSGPIALGLLVATALARRASRVSTASSGRKRAYFRG